MQSCAVFGYVDCDEGLWLTADSGATIRAEPAKVVSMPESESTSHVTRSVGWQVVPEEQIGTLGWWDGEDFVVLAFWRDDDWDYSTHGWSGPNPPVGALPDGVSDPRASGWQQSRDGRWHPPPPPPPPPPPLATGNSAESASLDPIVGWGVAAAVLAAVNLVIASYGFEQHWGQLSDRGVHYGWANASFWLAVITVVMGVAAILISNRSERPRGRHLWIGQMLSALSLGVALFVILMWIAPKSDKTLGVPSSSDQKSGNPTSSATADWEHDPRGLLDPVQAVPGGIYVSGHVADPDGGNPIQVVVSIDGSAPQTFVANGQTESGAIDFGFEAHMDASPGSHQVCVRAINVGPGNDYLLGCVNVTVP